MTDLRPTITPKSDQINADDLIGGARTITVSKVLLTDSADQPVSIRFEGDQGKPYKPCKSMRRLLVGIWGPDGNAYVGRSMTLYRDDSVTFGNAPVGGIRISHLSHIDRPQTIPLTEKRAQRKPYTVQPLKVQAETRPAQTTTAATPVDASGLADAADAAALEGLDAYQAFFGGLTKEQKQALLPDHAARKERAMAASTQRAETILRACRTVAELDEAWELLPVEVCREIGAGLLDDLKAQIGEG